MRERNTGVAADPGLPSGSKTVSSSGLSTSTSSDLSILSRSSLSSTSLGLFYFDLVGLA